MNESVQLKQENLQLLSEEIVRPKYDRSRIKAGIVHIGPRTNATCDQGRLAGSGVCTGQRPTAILRVLDHHLEGKELDQNPGRENALAAAEAVAAIAIFPHFSAEQRAKELTDFNDLAIHNPEVVSRQLDEVPQGVREQGRAATQSVELAPAV